MIASIVHQRIIFFVILALNPYLWAKEEMNASIQLKGHLQPLGMQGFHSDIQTIQGFRNPEEFFKSYVEKAKPVIFKGAALDYPAYKLWTSDEYFLSFQEGEYHEVVVEDRKKEVRTRFGIAVSFASYVTDYREKDVYMVNSVPEFLKKDVILPRCIACSDISSGNLVHNMMWFSSGGTKSVLHTDYAENILCLFEGRKQFYLIDKEFQDQVNVSEQGYSDVDVDSVDLLKYPGLHNIEFHHGTIYSGDCIYIPWLWVHQVRSFDRNVAVSIWWRHGLHLNFSSCNLPLNTTFENLTFIGFGALAEAQIKLMRNKMTAAVKAVGNFSVENLFQLFEQNFGFVSADEWTTELKELVQKMFGKLDVSSGDNIVTVDDLNKLQYKDWNDIRGLANEMENILMASPVEPTAVPGNSEDQNLNSQEEDANTNQQEVVRTQDFPSSRTIDKTKKDNLLSSDTVETRHSQHAEL